MGAHARLAATMAVLALSLAACGRGGTGDTDQAAEPAETVTVTAPAETVTVTETPSPTETDSDAAPAGDPCAELEGGEQLAFIFVTTPAPGQSVSSGFEVAGCSNTFEATYVWELLDREGTALGEDFGTASCGSGCVGDFSFTVDYDVDERQVATLRVFEESAEDGSEINVNSIPVVLEP